MNRRYADNAFLVPVSKEGEINTGISGLKGERKEHWFERKKANVCAKKKKPWEVDQFENVF